MDRTCQLLLVCLGGWAVINGQAEEVASYAPERAGEEDYRELMENSPFTRSLNLSSSLVLTGIAHIDEAPMATVIDLETKHSYFVSGEPNAQGWKLVELSPGEDLEATSVKISVGSGEMVRVRYDKESVENESKRHVKIVTEKIQQVAKARAEEVRNRARQFFAKIDQNALPKGYEGRTHQQYVDRRLAGMNNDQRRRVGQLWGEKQRVDPKMSNRGASFVRIMEFVAAGERSR